MNTCTRTYNFFIHKLFETLAFFLAEMLLIAQYIYTIYILICYEFYHYFSITTFVAKETQKKIFILVE